MSRSKHLFSYRILLTIFLSSSDPRVRHPHQPSLSPRSSFTPLWGYQRVSLTNTPLESNFFSLPPPISYTHHLPLPTILSLWPWTNSRLSFLSCLSLYMSFICLFLVITGNRPVSHIFVYSFESFPWSFKTDDIHVFRQEQTSRTV